MTETFLQQGVLGSVAGICKMADVIATQTTRAGHTKKAFSEAICLKKMHGA